MYKLNLEMAEEAEINCQHLLDHRVSKGIKKKKIYLCFIGYAKAFVWITTNCGKYLKRWEYQAMLLVSWDICVQVKNQQLKLDMEKLTGSKFGEEYV